MYPSFQPLLNKMKPRGTRHPPTLPLPWLLARTGTGTGTQTRNPIIRIPHSEVLQTIKNPNSSLKQILTIFSSAIKVPDFHHNYQTYHSLISLLCRRHQFKVADIILSIMRRRDGVTPGPTLLVPVVTGLCKDGNFTQAVELVFKHSKSSKVFIFLFNILIGKSELDVAKEFLFRTGDLDLRIQVRYYNTLIKEYADHIRTDDGIMVFKRMLCSGDFPDVITFSILIGSLGKEKRLIELNALFAKMLAMGVLPDMTCYKILYGVYLRNQMVSDANGIQREMQSLKSHCDQNYVLRSCGI